MKRAIPHFLLACTNVPLAIINFNAVLTGETKILAATLFALCFNMLAVGFCSGIGFTYFYRK